jgi:3-oxoacyl-[acyl-carrier protein] reductase
MHDDLIREFSLDGRAAVVTGAASGIGRATAVALAEAGAEVMVTDVNEAGAAETVAMIERFGGRATARRVDVSRREEVEALADEAARVMGRLDVWMTSAGTLSRSYILDVTEPELDRVIGINLKGPFWGMAAAGRVMKALGNGGSIISVSSGAADGPQVDLSVYAMTKAAVNMATRTAAKEFGPYGIRVNAIGPGWVETGMVEYQFRKADGTIDEEKRRQTVEMYAKGSPLNLTGKPRDIALAALYLASDASRFVTGQVMRPNGGMNMP